MSDFEDLAAELSNTTVSQASAAQQLQLLGLLTEDEFEEVRKALGVLAYYGRTAYTRGEAGAA